MKVIKYISLFNHLVTKEGNNPFSACKAISEIRHLPKEFKEAIFYALDGKIMDITYHNVSLSELVSEDKMHPIRAILMLDWIRREPAVAIRYMGEEYRRASIEISDLNKKKLEYAIARLRKPISQKEDQINKNDIVIE